jgi:thymidylate kinase
MVRSGFELRRTDLASYLHRNATRNKLAQDFADLSPQVDPAQLQKRASQIFGSEIALRVRKQFASDEPFASCAGLRRAIEQELEPYAIYGSPERFLRLLARNAIYAAAQVNCRFLRLARLPRRSPIGGGVVIAIVGVDGSGKSSVISGLSEWLEQEIDVLPIYFGTGDGRPSFILWPFKQLVPLFARFIREKPRGASHGVISDRNPGPLYSFLFAVWAMAVAIEKRHKIIVSRRAASRGFVVLTDRYPQNQTPEYNDGPLLGRIERAPAWLRRFEVSAYQLAARTPPDVVLKLQVRPETSAGRETTMDPSVIRRRIELLRGLTFEGSRMVVVDAEQPLEDVLKAVRKEVWHAF